MTCPSRNRLILNLILSCAVIVLSLPGTAVGEIPDRENDYMKNIHSIAVKEGVHETTVLVRGDGIIPAYRTQAIETPPKVIIDIFCETAEFKSINRPVSGLRLKTIRVGHHPKSIRMVLDLNGPGIPGFSVIKRHNELRIVLGPPGNQAEMEKPVAHRPQIPLEKKPDNLSQKTEEAGYSGEENPAHMVSAAPGPEETEVPTVQKVRIIRPYNDPLRSVDALMRMEQNDGQDDAKLFSDAITAYAARDLSAAIGHLRRLIESYPDGRYTEKAYFLFAKANEQYYSDSLNSHFYDVKDAYEDAIYRYPQSDFIPDAQVSIGNLCFNVKNYFEALGYYNLVIGKGKDPAATLKAFMQKAKMLSLKGKYEDTLTIYEQVLLQYPGTTEAIQAKFEMVTILFEMNNFRKSLHILSGLKKQFINSYTYPEIYLYMGNNYYQLSDNIMARRNLLKYYNLRPEEEESHLVLTRIADTYREEKRPKDAAKFYKLVIERYPDTEGALISMYRLAEQQEKGEITVSAAKLTPKIEIMGQEVSVPKKIYEDVIQKGIKKGEDSSLIQFALLKLSILDKNEENYEKGLVILKGLLQKYPRTKLRKEIEHTLEEILLSILKKDLKFKQYNHIVNVYSNEKKLMQRLGSPEIFLIVARASLELNLNDMAVEFYFKADPLLSNEQKPPDLLLHVGRSLLENGDLKRARTYLDLFLSRPASDKYIVDAYQMRGNLFLTEQKYPQAMEMFSNALKTNPSSSMRTRIHLSKAKALMAVNAQEDAYQSVQKAESISKQYHEPDINIYHEIGDLYIRLGYSDEALAIIKYAMEITGGGEGATRLKLLMARGYEVLNKKKDYLVIYNEVAAGNDAFWSSVAREKIAEANFEDIISQKKQ